MEDARVSLMALGTNGRVVPSVGSLKTLWPRQCISIYIGWYVHMFVSNGSLFSVSYQLR